MESNLLVVIQLRSFLHLLIENKTLLSKICQGSMFPRFVLGIPAPCSRKSECFQEHLFPIYEILDLFRHTCSHSYYLGTFSGTPVPVSVPLEPFQTHLFPVPVNWNLFRHTCSCYNSLGTFSGTPVPCSLKLKYFQEYVFLFLFPNVFQVLGNMFPKFWGTY